MSLDLLKPTNGQPKKPSELRDNFQHILGAALPDCILSEPDGTFGGKLSTIPGTLGVGYSTFSALIGGKYHRAASGQITNLNARSAQILYATKNTNTDQITPTIASALCQYPTADASTVLRYIMSESSNPQDTSGNNNHIATMNGTTRVDGWNGYARYFNGTSDYMVSTGTTNFPVGSAERELTVIFTPNRVNADQHIVGYGADAGSQAFSVVTIPTGELYIWTNSSNDINTGFKLEVGKTYIVHLQNKANKTFVYVNGNLLLAQNHTLNTAASVIKLGTKVNNTQFFQGTIHYVELRNKIRTAQQIAQIANKWGIPLRYQGSAATYPVNPTDTGFHVWKFNETSGNNIADENTTSPLTLTATGTTILDSEIGLGKSRYFNGTTDKATGSAYAFPSAFTIIFCGKVDDYGSVRPLISNRPSGNGDGITAILGTDGIIALDTTAGSKGTYRFPIGKQFFVAITYASGTATLYENAPSPTGSVSFTVRTGSNALVIGYDIPHNTYFKGNMDYLAIIPRALSTAEVATIYNALMKTVERSIVTDLLPANSIALGYIRTDSTRVIELDDFSYKYGRNEGIGKAEGNKRVVLPWKYFSGANTFYYDNPLGTTNIKMTPLFVNDLSIGTKMYQQYGYEYDGVQYNNMLVSAEPSGKIKLVTGVSQQGTGQGAGYASALLEVI